MAKCIQSPSRKSNKYITTTTTTTTTTINNDKPKARIKKKTKHYN
jgi:hypothetical protein